MKRKYIYTNKNGNFSYLSNLSLDLSFILLFNQKYCILCRTEKKNGNESAFLQRNYLKTIENLNHLFPSTPASTIYNEEFFSRYFTRNNWKKKKKQNSSLLTAKSSQLSLEF